MDSARPSIRDLNRDEQRFVIRTFLLAIGADQGLTRLAHVKREVRYEDVLKVLNVSTWPTAEATQVELAWMSEPLCHPDFPRLQTYSVFWSSSSALELWVGTTPRKPIQQSSFLTGATLLSTIIAGYRASFARRNHPVNHLSGVIHDHHRRQSADSSPIASVSAGVARRRPGRGRRPGVRPLRQHQARLSDPVEAFRRMVRRDGPALPACRTPHRCPLPGRPRR